MTKFRYTARIVPLGRPFRMPGDDVPFLFDASSFAAERLRPWDTPVRLNHEVTKDVGMLHDLRPGKEWWLAEFMLDPALSSVLEVGQPVSVRISTMRASGNHYLSELSIVRRGAVKGAEIISRRAIKATAPDPTRRAEPAGEVTFGHGQIIRRPNIGRVTAVEGRPVGTVKRSRTAGSRTAITRRFTDGSVEVTTFDANGVAREWEVRS